MKWQVVLAALLIVAQARAAENTVVVSRYRAQDLISVRTRVRFTTLIVLPAGEEISEVSCGDKEYWVIDGKENTLHVKPSREGAVTNLNVVLKSKAIYSFVVEEVGAKGIPDLKVVVQPDDVLRLRDEKAGVEKTLKEQTAAHARELAEFRQARESYEADHKAALAEMEKGLRDRLAEHLVKQTFNYSCFTKTDICLAAVFGMGASTYVIGRLGPSPYFSGTDDKGVRQSGVPFERRENVYKLSKRLVSGTIYHGAKSVTFYLQ